MIMVFLFGRQSNFLSIKIYKFKGIYTRYFGNLIFVFLPPNVPVAFWGQVFVMWYELVVQK